MAALEQLANDGGALLRRLADSRGTGEAEFEAAVSAVEEWVRAVQDAVNPPGPEGVGTPDGPGDVATPVEVPAEEAAAESAEPVAEAPESIEGGTTAEEATAE